MITASPLTGAIEILILIIMCIFSVPIGGAMLVTGLVFALLYYGDITGIKLAALTIWSHANSYSLSMLPLFILMGGIMGECELGRDGYDCFHKWLSKLKGGLAIVATVTSATFGAITGSTGATIATIGGISVPEMRKRGYSRELRLGSVAVAGMLANLIPPSVVAIFYCALFEVSLGKVFIAGIIPGIILTIMFSVTIYIWVSLKPSIAVAVTESYTFKEKMASLKKPLPIFIIFLGMIGGIYVGFFSPTEAAGIGVIYALAMTMIMRRLTWERFKVGMLGTLRITAFIIFIILGAYVFSHTIALSRFADFLSGIVLGLNIHPLGIMFAIIVLFIALGCVLDMFALMVLFTPLFFPCILQLGYDAVWYGTLTVVLIEVALITPPIAANLYIAQGLESDATFMDVVRGVVPFYTCTIILLILLVLFPQIALWLPNMMK